MLTCIVCNKGVDAFDRCFHPFPTDPTQRKIWITNMIAAKVPFVMKKPDDWIPNFTEPVCSDHFEAIDFEGSKRYPDDKSKLKIGAFPTVFGATKIKRVKKRDGKRGRPSKTSIKRELDDEDDEDLDESAFADASELNIKSETIMPESSKSKRKADDIADGDGEPKKKKESGAEEDAAETPGEDHSYAGETGAQKGSRANSPSPDTNLVWQLGSDDESTPEELNAKFQAQIKKINIVNEQLKKQVSEVLVERDVLNKYLDESRKAFYKITKELTQVEMNTSKNMTAMNKIFNDDQKLALRKSVYVVKDWSDDTLRKGYELLFASGVKGYEYLLNEGYPYPPVKVLRKKALTFDFDNIMFKEKEKEKEDGKDENQQENEGFEGTSEQAVLEAAAAAEAAAVAGADGVGQADNKGFVDSDLLNLGQQIPEFMME